MKKRTFGFTLIELLAIVTLLGIVLLIAVPMVLSTLNNSKEKTDKNIVDNILSGAKLYYVESMFDENKNIKINGITNVYDDIELDGKKPEGGEVYIKIDGLIAMIINLNDKCYRKVFKGNLEITTNSNCELNLLEE